jgi:hypothetical protein
MNDFTKKELLLILEWGLSFMFQNGLEQSIENGTKDTCDKIRTMTEHYKEPCQHKWLNMAYAYMQCEWCGRRKGMNDE